MLEHISTFLARLDNVRPQGQDKWQARCPAHKDRSPSLSIAVGDDGRLLVHCHAECGIDAICGALGIEIHDLFPPRETAGRRIAWNPRAILDAVAMDAVHVMLYGRSLMAGTAPTETQHAALAGAVMRIQRAVELTRRTPHG